MIHWPDAQPLCAYQTNVLHDAKEAESFVLLHTEHIRLPNAPATTKGPSIALTDVFSESSVAWYSLSHLSMRKSLRLVLAPL